MLGAQDIAWRNDHLLLVVNTSADPTVEKSAVEALIDRGVDGLLYAAMSWRGVVLPQSFVSLPSVLVNCWPAADPCPPAVVPSELEGGRRAVGELVEHGHREIAFLGGVPTDAATQDRERGFREACRDAGLPVRDHWVRHGDYGMASGYRLVSELYARADSRTPTGLVCGNDRMAAGAMSALVALGYPVPTAVSVVGYDNQEGLADQLTPGLTTVSIPHYEMGRAGIEQLLDMLSGATAAATRVVPGQLIRRSSVAPPPVTTR